MVSPSPSAQVLLGRYRVLETNTEGGFGTVSVCWDSRLQRRVAIKRMPLRLDDSSPAQASTLEEALAEARTSSLLAHPNIVTMFDFETDDRYSYLVLEFVDGLSLADLLARVEDGVLTFDECAHLVDSLSSALAYAHENGVLHLDIKPANILIDRSGTVKLGDFGMATLASAAGYGGARGGTVGFMPPEQIEGGLVDERTDVFALAVVVWTALTGRCPYVAPTSEQSLELIRRGPSPALSRIEPELAGIVEETLLRALEPDPRLRLASVDTFARDLVRALGDAEDGAESLRDLLNQTDESEEPHPVEDWGRLHVPLLVRFPWLGAACTRLLAAGVAGWAAFQVVPYILGGIRDAALYGTIGTVGVAAASAAWPPLTGFLGIAALVSAVLAQPARFAMPLALAIGIPGLAWWLVTGRRSHLAGTALLLPSCLSSPLAGVGLAGFALNPLSAFATGAASWLLYLVFSATRTHGFYADTLAEQLLVVAGEPHTWIMAAGCGLASLVCAALTRRGKVALGILGQVLGAVILVLPYLLRAHMEKDSITMALDATAIGIAVILGATLCIAIVLMGESVQDWEDDRT